MEGFWLEHHRALLAFAITLTRDSVLAEDLIQDAAFQLAKHWARVDESSRLAWVFKVVRNRWKTELRQRRIRRLVSLDSAAEPQSDDDPAAQVIDGIAVREVLAGLSERDLQVFALRVYANRTFAEIGRELYMSGRNAQYTYRRVEAKLEQL